MEKVENVGFTDKPVVNNVIPTDGTNAQPQEKPQENAAPKAETNSPAPNPILEKVLKEKKNAMERVRQLESEMQQINDQRLKEKEDWKSLYEQRDSEFKTLRQELDQANHERINGHKLSALKKELSKMGAQEHSMNALLKLADIEAMKYDNEHKVVLGVDTAAKSIYESIPAAFGKPVVGVNSDAPNNIVSEFSMEAWKSMPISERNKPENIAKVMELGGLKAKR